LKAGPEKQADIGVTHACHQTYFRAQVFERLCIGLQLAAGFGHAVQTTKFAVKDLSSCAFGKRLNIFRHSDAD